jgi:hypothetical protein
MKRLSIGLTALSLVLTACNPSFGSTPTPAASVTGSPSSVTITVFFTNLPNFQVGKEPYETAVTRTVAATNSLPDAVLTQLFLGPTDAEKAQGLAVFLDGATGYSQLSLADGVARVYLTGDCNSNGATYTIANLIDANLKQFPEIKWIKIYDPNGETETPDGQSGSIPFCLEP